MFDTFKAKAEASGNTEVQRFAAKAEALKFIEGYFKKEDIKDAAGSYAVWADSPFLKRVDTKALAARVPGLKFEVTGELAKNSKIGITQMDWGIANTGTLAQDATKAEQRLASTLSRIHIMLLATDNIVADLQEFVTKMHPNKSNYLTMITGPSKTADIERVLAIGVHGPERIVIICVDELGGMNS
ncbi:MAG TPA: lactate utilization protein [Nitrospirota bacterium]|nr:lactate utilization protein [Nitrospirota bacterium]